MTTKEETKNEVQEVVSSEHQQWLKNPITIMALNIIRKHKDKHINTITGGAASLTNDEIRCFAYGIKTDMVLIEALTNTKEFINKSKE
jgi:hypothetical protein